MPNKLSATLKSKTHRKIMLFFAENQGSIDTPRGVAAWTNESLQKVRIALEDLVKVGLLKAHRTSSTIGYSSALTKKQLDQVLVRLKQK